MDPQALEELTASVRQMGIIGKSPATISEALSLNRLPWEIRDECRKDSTVPKKVLVVIARNKQQRSMTTQFRKNRDPQAKTGFQKSPGVKRSRAETLAGQIGVMKNRNGNLDLPSFSAEDREMVTEAQTSLKNTLEDAPPRRTIRAEI
jgi:hypothetical protein